MGEHVSPDVFRVVDFSVQRRSGSFASFLRVPGQHAGHLERFFRGTGKDYTRFNYLGEWHSHPAFMLRPSGDDLAAMRDIVDDPQTGATFAVLVIVRLSGADTLEASCWLFVPGLSIVHPVTIALEGDATAVTVIDSDESLFRRGCRMIAGLKATWARSAPHIRLHQPSSAADSDED